MILITVVIATYNSEKLLPQVLSSIRQQSVSQKEVEILLVDGGSTDSTRQIGAIYDCRWIENIEKDPVSAKYLGFLEARGIYVIYLDHDEVFLNRFGLEERLQVFRDFPKVRTVVTSGYLTPEDSNPINVYINEFGDPFSFFMYRDSKDAHYFVNNFRRHLLIDAETSNFLVGRRNTKNSLCILELLAMGSMIDAKYIREALSHSIAKERLPHLFYDIVTGDNQVAIMKRDPLLHYSSETVSRYIKKIEWRVRNNIFRREHFGKSGFSGRESFGIWGKYKKMFFIPYTLLIFPLVFDTVYLVLSRGKFVYLLHFPLTLITVFLILYNMLRKIVGIELEARRYGE